MQEIEAFPRNKWGIPEPQGIAFSRDGLPDIDLVIVPGVAFDSTCQRLGHGKGYYDCFLHRLAGQRLSAHRPLPVTIVSTASDPESRLTWVGGRLQRASGQRGPRQRE